MWLYKYLNGSEVDIEYDIFEKDFNIAESGLN